jgi:hypothetical protein
MATYTVGDSQRKAARVVGALYLFDFVAVFNQFYVRGRLISPFRRDRGNSAGTLTGQDESRAQWSPSNCETSL